MTAPASAAILSGLRRSRDEPQLTQALAAVCRADPEFASRFLSLIVEAATGMRFDLPSHLEVTAEEVARRSRFDLRFRARDWDVIVELKIHADYT